MAGKKLESFKISETRKPGGAKPKKAKEKKEAGPEGTQSVGFARIEKILENDAAATVTENLSKLLQSLEEFDRGAKTNKDKAAAKKAVIAVERTADLLDYLFQTKASMQTSR